MRIISKHRDYYDGYMNHDKKDRFNKLWLRTEIEFFVKTEVIKELMENHVRFRTWGWEAAFMIIAGKVIPFIIHEPEHTYYEKDRKVHSFFDADAAWDAYSKSVDERRMSYWWKKPTKQRFVKFFDATYPDLTDICIDRGTPLFVIQPEARYFDTGYDHVKNARMNVNLKAHGFTKYLGAAEMFQEIEMFVNNIMVNDDMPGIVSDDKIKVQSHGFDPKYGFRTRPKK